MAKTIEELEAENEQLRDELDALHMRYLSQVSLWKSNYEELKKKLAEPVDEEKLDELAERYCPIYPKYIDAESFDIQEAFKDGYRKMWEDMQ